MESSWTLCEIKSAEKRPISAGTPIPPPKLHSSLPRPIQFVTAAASLCQTEREGVIFGGLSS